MKQQGSVEKILHRYCNVLNNHVLNSHANKWFTPHFSTLAAFNLHSAPSSVLLLTSAGRRHVMAARLSLGVSFSQRVVAVNFTSRDDMKFLTNVVFS